ncbi:MAG: aspartate-semialdehyde dehydrogenase [Holosporaceae bacterium]|nr:aspartate-semialdehyde dehydrogenase [Holosporaceae bacterium]
MIRLLTKRRYFEDFLGAYDAQDRSVHVVHEDPSIGATQELPEERMSRKKSIENRYNVAIVGATGNAGAATMRILEERNFPIGNIIAVASERSVNRTISFGTRSVKVQSIAGVNWQDVDLAFFCVGGAVSRRYAETVTNDGCVVIDKSSYFRLNAKVPLIIPEVNGNLLQGGAPLGIISTPNCIAVPLIMTLKALSALATLKKIVVSTYQSVSGAGRLAINELYRQSRESIMAIATHHEVFPKQIAFNVIPLIGYLDESGVSEEEDKISSEVCKILKKNLLVSVTCVRVPVFIGHSMSVVCEFSSPVAIDAIFESFENASGIVVIDRRGEHSSFATPLDTAGEDSVFVSRIRTHPSSQNLLLYWISCDNLRKGAALNSVQIAESLLSIDPSLNGFKKSASIP